MKIMKRWKRGEGGFTFLEMMAVLVIIGVILATAATRTSRSVNMAFARLMQVALEDARAEDNSANYPANATVTIAYLIENGAPAAIVDWTLDSYVRSANKRSYTMQLTTLDAQIFCVVPSSVTRGACP